MALVILIGVLMPPIISNANLNTTSNTHKVKLSTNDLLITLISPKIDEAVKKRYNKTLNWKVDKIIKISSYGEDNRQSGFLLDILVDLGDTKENKLEQFIIKIENPENLNYKIPQETP